ncbi:MAG TPA: hypothetical protein VFQ30_07555 [Ktedonobacteraceae bacterium]|nr:hypothetical protein [Ktedonobacteraceae bacterium]
MIPSSDRFDQSVIAALLDEDPLVADYRPSLPSLTGRSSSAGKPHARPFTALMAIRSRPISKPISSASKKA